MKLYIFTLDYLSTVQKGIQAAHVTAEIMTKDDGDVDHWFDNDKTIIMLEGGNYQMLRTILQAAQTSNLANAYFYEDRNTLGGLLTAVAVIAELENYSYSDDDPNNNILYYIRNQRKVTQ